MQRLKEAIAKDRELINAQLCNYEDAQSSKKTLDKEINYLRN